MADDTSISYNPHPWVNSYKNCFIDWLVFYSRFSNISAIMKTIILSLIHNWSVFSSFHSNITQIFQLDELNRLWIYTCIFNIAIIVNNLLVIVTCTSPLFILIWKEFLVFLKSGIWLAEKQLVGTKQNV
jgi:hypothetical protein